jgi:hypothetical protein
MRLFAVPLLLVVAVLGGACSSSATKSAASRPSTQVVAKQIAKQLTASKFLDQKTATCIGNDVAPKLSVAGESFSKSGVQAVTGLSTSDQKVLDDAFDKCVTATQFAAIVANGTAGATVGASSPVTTCLSAKLVQQYATSGAMFQALFGKQGQASILSMMTSCGVPGISPPTST